MFLSDAGIKKAIKKGDLSITDFDPKRLQPASYDILLGNKFIVTDSHSTTIIDPVRGIYPKTHEVNLKDDDKFVLHPGLSIIGYSRERFGSDVYMIEVNGKSSLARIGLLVHNSASLVNPGHYLNVALELCNLNNVPIVLRPKMPIAQLTVSTLTGPPSVEYKKTGRYHKDNMKGYLPEKKSN